MEHAKESCPIFANTRSNIEYNVKESTVPANDSTSKKELESKIQFQMREMIAMAWATS